MGEVSLRALGSSRIAPCRGYGHIGIRRLGL